MAYGGKMGTLEVLNVGQGDSIILNPSKGCTYDTIKFLIDLGPGQYDVTQHIGDKEKVHVFITHHDMDHLDGFRYFVNKMHLIEEITIPFYQNEITLIAQSILNLKGINTSKDCKEFIDGLNQIVNNQIFLKTLIKGYRSTPKLSFAYDGRRICNHIECLNPPVSMETYDWLEEAVEKDFRMLFHEVFDEKFARELDIYIRANKNNHSVVDSQELLRIFLWENDEEQYDEMNRIKANYVVSFFMENSSLFRAFNSKPTRKNLEKIYNNFVKCTHDACIVLRVTYDGKFFLLTGDASKKVFNRLIREGKDISANYLKMPHHGSKYNMNKKILKEIAPEAVIISHKNGHFGKSSDPHPNREILQMLHEENIKVFITNDVIKEGVVCMKKEAHKGDFYVQIL